MDLPLRTTTGRLVPAVGRDRRRRSAAEVTPYDFRRPVKLSRENARTLQIAFETFARQASTVLTSALRSVCQVTLVDVEQRSYTEYVDSLPDLTHMTVFSAEPIQQRAILEMPTPLMMACVDRLLGGPGTATQPDRQLTDLESAVVRGLQDRVVAEIRYAFSSLVALEPAVVGVEYSPQLVQLAGATDAMIVARFDVRREAGEHRLTLAMSFNGLLPFLTAAGASATVSERERQAREQASAQLHAGFQEVPVDVSVRFRATAVDPVELSALQAGDVVRLRHPAQAPLDVTAADVVFAHATPGTQGTRLAALVVASPRQENS